MANAQNAPDALAVLVENVSEDGAKCGLSTARLTASLRSAMRYNRIAEAESDPSGTFAYLVTTSIADSGTCFTSVEVRIQKFMKAFIDGVGPVYATTVFCNQSGIYSGYDMPRRVDAAIKEHFQICLSAIVDSKVE